MIASAESLMAEIAEKGGMAKAIDEGLPKLRIEEAAASKQAAIDRGRDKIVGVNLFQVDEEDDVEVLVVDQDEVQRQQLGGLASLKATRDQAAVDVGPQCPHVGSAGIYLFTYDGDNLLAASVEAARVRCTLGEISSALEAVFTRFQPADRRVSGVFSRAMEGSEAYDNVRALSDAFASRAGCGAVPSAQSAFLWPRWGRTATTGAPRWSPRPSPTSGLTWTSVRCSARPQRIWRARPLKTTSTWSASCTLAAGHH